ncbi:MAG: 2OG-Fe(II) oxygenase [Ectothiorhodospiraceae bacterium]|nr:2OG-Fe(II) oxygenase [Ectothiorhodospiraceae bacterium]
MEAVGTRVRSRLVRVVDGLAENGLAVVPRFLPPGLVEPLGAEVRQQWVSGAFRQAAVGRGTRRQLRPDVRRDHVRWLDPLDCSPPERGWLRTMERLRRALNRELQLGLLDFETHATVYPPGAFYRAHLDRFADADHRTVSCIAYLNHDWSVADGGALRIHLDGDAAGTFLDVSPLAGTLVVFDSGRYRHEVLAARRERMSLTGWFTRRV